MKLAKGRLKWLGISLAGLAASLGLVAWFTLTFILVRPPSYQPVNVSDVQLRSWPEHNAIYQDTDFPYVLSIQGSEGALEYVGALHTSNVDHPQLKQIQTRWNQFQASVVLCEGRQRMNRYSSIPESGDLSESQLVRILAYENGLPLYSLEPEYADEVAGLLKQFEPKLVAMYMTLRAYTSESTGVAPQHQDSLAWGLLKKRSRVEGLRDTFSNIKEMDAYWKQTFPDAPDWRTLENTESLPLLVKIGNASRQIRGQHMVSTIVELVSRGERVFAVVGASHVIRQELELKRLIETAD